jgi:hypothetical protein
MTWVPHTDVVDPEPTLITRAVDDITGDQAARATRVVVAGSEKASPPFVKLINHTRWQW